MVTVLFDWNSLAFTVTSLLIMLLQGVAEEHQNPHWQRLKFQAIPQDQQQMTEKQPVSLREPMVLWNFFFSKEKRWVSDQWLWAGYGSIPPPPPQAQGQPEDSGYNPAVFRPLLLAVSVPEPCSTELCANDNLQQQLAMAALSALRVF